MNISIFGLGYVGCVGIGCLSKQGHTMVGVDVSDVKVDLINQGKPTIVEKDIDFKLMEKAFNIEIERNRQISHYIPMH